MHLCDRSGRDRRAERREQVGQWLTQRNRDGALGVGLWEWRHLVLQRLEVARHLHPDNIRPGCQKLAELDVGGTEPREGRSETVGGDAARWPLDQPRDAQ